MRQAATVYEGPGAMARLVELGSDGEAVRQSVMAGLTARFSCSENAPRTAPGLLQWSTSTEALRETHALMGWTRTDVDNFPLTVSPDRATAMGIIRGDAATGRRDADPTTARRRGPVTRRVVDRNSLQLDLFAINRPVDTSADAAEPVTYFVLAYRDDDAGEARVEVSLPSAFDDGFVSAWAERIILPPIELDPIDPAKRRRDEDEQIDIDVVRRR